MLPMDLFQAQEVTLLQHELMKLKTFSEKSSRGLFARFHELEGTVIELQKALETLTKGPQNVAKD